MHILCAICSDILTDNINVTKCGHVFHSPCLSQWIEISKTCPQCRNKVTLSCIFRLYPTVSNEASSDDVTVLHSKLDEAKLQLLEFKNACNDKEKKLTDLDTKYKKNEEALRAAEKKILSLDSAVMALKEQLQYVKIQNKETQKLKEENEILKNKLQLLNGLQKVLNATNAEVEQMVHGYTDVRTVAVFATALKRALCESESKKNELRDQLQEVKQKLSAECKLCELYLTKYRQMMSMQKDFDLVQRKRKASEDLDKSLFENSVTSAMQVTDLDQSMSDSVLKSDTDVSLNTLVKKIENADSPYLNLKQGNIALAALHRQSSRIASDGKLKPSEFAMLNSAHNVNNFKVFKKENPFANQNKKLSIFQKNVTVNLIDVEDPKPSNSKTDVSYDGLGGHAKLDEFPTPKQTLWKPKCNISKLTSKHRLKNNYTANSQDISKMLAKQRNNK